MMEKNLKQAGYNKNRRTLKQQKNIDKKSYNLKQLHQSFCQQFDQHYRTAQRSSAAQLQIQNRQNGTNMYQKSQRKTKRESSVNFYINIDKLKNLKISNKDKTKYDSMSAYLNNNSKNLTHNRKSLYMKYPHSKKNIHQSFQYSKNSNSQLQKNNYNNRSVQHNYNQNNYQKSKARYKTQSQQKLDNNSQNYLSKGFLMKRNNFRRTKNNQVKDKTFIQGYLKGKQLGRGGFSKVWQGFHFQTKIFYAVKQIDTQNKYQTHLTQIWFGNYFFINGRPKSQFSKHPGIKTLITMYDYSIVDPRAFIVYESCDGSLGNLLYDIYQEDGKDDDEDDDNKLYMIKYKKLYGQLRKSTSFLKCMIYQICQALDLLVSNKIIHSDLKTQNILLKKNQSNGIKFKLIDYGSSFMFQSLKQYKLATPQYMCPQLLNYILYQNKKDYHPKLLTYMKDYKNISSIDVWSFGCIILQLIHGLPLWLTNPTKIYVGGKFQTKKGLFAVSDRSFAKILERQLYIVQNMDSFLQKNNNSGIMVDEKLKTILVGMLNPNPQLRFRPNQILSMLKNS